MKRLYFFALIAAASYGNMLADSPANLGAFFYDDAFSYNVIDENARTCQVSDWRYTYAKDSVMTIPETAVYNDVTYTVVKVGDKAFDYPPLAKHVVEKIVMPNSITEIGDNAFCSHQMSVVQFEDLSEIVWPSNIKKIGKNVFRDTYSYTDIVLPESLEEVGDGCFLSQSKKYTGQRPGEESVGMYFPLKSLYIGKNLRKIGANAFGNTRFSNVSISEENKNFTLDSITEANDLFLFEFKTYILYDSTKETLISMFSNRPNLDINTPTAPDGFISPDDFAWDFNVPENVKSIADYALKGNCCFRKLHIGANVSTLGTNSLNGVTANGMVVIDRLDPPTVASGSVFEPPYGCDYNKLMIYVPAKVLNTYKTTQGFNNPLYVLIYPMESIGLKSEAVGVEAQGHDTFEQDGYIFKILDDSIATCAIVGGTALDSIDGGDDQWIDLPTKVYYDTNKKSYTITEIGKGAFKDKDAIDKRSKIERIIFPIKLESIGDEAFAGTTVKRVEFPKTLKKIGRCAFENSFTKGCILPVSLEELGDNAFMNNCLSDGFSDKMSEMSDGIQIGSGLAHIGKAAFTGNMPEFITLLPENGTYSLDSILTVAQGKPMKLYALFDKERTSLQLMLANRIKYMNGTLNLNPDSISVEYHVPSTVTRIEDYAFTGQLYYPSAYWTWRLNGGVSRIYIPESVTYLGKYSLTGIGGGDIIFEGDVPPEMPEPAFFPGTDIQDGARLYARKEAIEAFKASEQWAAYEIIPIEYVGIEGIEADNSSEDSEELYPVYDLYGRVVMQEASEADLNNLEKGIYIYNGEKIFR